MGIERLARKNRQLQKHALKHWARNMPSEVRERIIAHDQRQRRLAAMKRAATWCGLGMIFIVACVLAFGGCGLDSSSIEPCFSMGVDAQPDADRSDVVASSSDVGGHVDVGSDATTMDGANIDTRQQTGLGDGGAKRDTQPSSLDDGLCWYKQECPVGHFHCANDDGTPVADAQCLTKRNLCLCCDTSIPAFSCVGVSQ